LAKPWNFSLWVVVSREASNCFCLLSGQFLADWAQARAGLLWEEANAHAEVAAAHEAKLQAQIEAVRRGGTVTVTLQRSTPMCSNSVTS
jgi:hypothetical protein